MFCYQVHGAQHLRNIQRVRLPEEQAEVLLLRAGHGPGGDQGLGAAADGEGRQLRGGEDRHSQYLQSIYTISRVYLLQHTRTLRDIHTGD